MELHHIVVIRDNKIKNNSGVYTIDFSPENPDPFNLIKMLLCQNVSGLNLNLRNLTISYI